MMENPEAIALHKLFDDLKSGESYGEELRNVRFPCWYPVLEYDRIKSLFYWRHYGSSANYATLEDLKWILAVIFEMSAVEFLEKYIAKSKSELA